jgi:hypothetical protein
MRRSIALAVTTTALILGSTTEARAVPPSCANDITTTSNDDVTLADNLNPCGSVRNANIGVVRNNFDMVSDDWGPGFDCDDSSDVMKMVNAGELVFAGINFTRGSNLILESYHATFFPDGDYSNLTFSGSSSWHDWFRDQISASTGIADFQTRSGVYIPNLIHLTCPLFDTGLISAIFGRVAVADPELRAEVLVHESWHAWEDKHNQDINTTCGHAQCPNDGHPTMGFCRANWECDNWYPHPLGDKGSMNNTMHRPYQTMAEFACDIVDTPENYVPLTIRERAAANADTWGLVADLNGPGDTCTGIGAGQSYAICSSGTQCDAETPCGSGLCNPQTGCCDSFYGCNTPGSAVCDGMCPCNFSTGCCTASCSSGATSCLNSSGKPDQSVCAAGFFCDGTGCCLEISQ